MYLLFIICFVHVYIGVSSYQFDVVYIDICKMSLWYFSAKAHIVIFYMLPIYQFFFQMKNTRTISSLFLQSSLLWKSWGWWIYWATWKSKELLSTNTSDSSIPTYCKAAQASGIIKRKLTQGRYYRIICLKFKFIP